MRVNKSIRKQERILLNFATLKKGGGQNVGINFIKNLKQQGLIENYVYAVVADSVIHTLLIEFAAKNIITMSSNPLKRMIKEFLLGPFLIRKHKINLIYTYFGIGLYPRRIRQISGCADSNLFFPEIDFWADYKGYKKIYKTIIDKYRIWGLKRATAVIFENDLMQRRGEQLFNLRRTIFIKPSIYTDYKRKKLHLPTKLNKSTKVGLFFCSWQKNKNYELIPLIAKELQHKNFDFHFLFTAPSDYSSEHENFLRQIRNLEVENYISIIGPIKRTEIASLYDQIDIVFLLSRLESFSNNIIEAWHFHKPLIAADEPWARSICKNAAFYVNRNNHEQIAHGIIMLLQNPQRIECIVEEGKMNLLTYPSITDKTNQELNFLKLIYEDF